jgi:hypothetical protein
MMQAVLRKRKEKRKNRVNMALALIVASTRNERQSRRNWDINEDLQYSVQRFTQKYHLNQEDFRYLVCILGPDLQRTFTGGVTVFHLH